MPVDPEPSMEDSRNCADNQYRWCLSQGMNSSPGRHLINLNIPNPLRYKLSYSCMDLGDVQTDVQIPVSAYELAERDLLFCKACPSRSQVSLPC